MSTAFATMIILTRAQARAVGLDTPVTTAITEEDARAGAFQIDLRDLHRAGIGAALVYDRAPHRGRSRPGNHQRWVSVWRQRPATKPQLQREQVRSESLGPKPIHRARKPAAQTNLNHA